MRKPRKKADPNETRVLTEELKQQILNVLFPMGHSDDGKDNYIGPVPARWGYNIMELSTDTAYGESDDVFHLILHKLSDADSASIMLGFYVGMMSYAFPMFYSNNDQFDETFNVLSFKWVPKTDDGPFWGKKDQPKK